ncbi:Flp pilus assembly protein CpaB [Maritimibacter sp. 55A14]|uniref:Flp pilus assembly protein CpaB n=1 Tax=Maritimibacter sp. 55A14 TaxID=2174844 RepID=UPI000D61F664|nr:Flp pilus assembly protein CpaB [Maritimibacter sp. 55A14]PWE31987.1 Flp pilus assembly protein CpaB [Maritimibacter sp. 55A14]
MRAVFALVLLLGLGLAGFAVYVAQKEFSKYQAKVAAQEAQLAKNVKLTQVWVTSRNVRYGERLRKDDVQLVPWPENFLPEGTFVADNSPVPEDEDKLRSVLRMMEKHEPIMEQKVTRPGEDAGLTSRLPSGMRAFAIRVDVASGVSGFLRPGERVDVYWSGQLERQKITKLILDGVTIIAIDQIADQDHNKPIIARTVTVEVNPQSVGILAQAQSTGSLSLSLRGAEDDLHVETVEIDQRELLGIEEVAPEVVEEEKKCTVRTRKGAEVVTITIPCPDES